MRPTSILLAIGALVWPAALTALAQITIHVPSQAPTIQVALDQAAHGDTILVAPGIYPVANLRTWGKEVHLVSEGGNSMTTLSGGGANRVFHIRDGESVDTVIEGFRITIGKAPNGGTGGAGNGGGNILIDGASPFFRDCIVEFGLAGNGGTGATGAGGGSGGHGGGVYVLNGSPRFDRCVFRENNAGNGGAGGGGANGVDGTIVAHHGGDGGNGGGGGGGGHGGAVYVIGAASSPSFANCLFHRNRAGKGGAGGKGGSGGDGYTFSIAAGDGGDGGSGGNGANGGSATLYVTGGAAALVTSCTFERNFLADRGQGGAGGALGVGEPNGVNGSNGAIGSYATHAGLFAASGVLVVHNTALWDHNSISDVGGPLLLIEVGGAANCINSAARTPISGSNCFVLPTNPFDSNHVPLAASPVVDAGDEALLPNWTSNDLDGGTRLFDSELVAGFSRLDIGAHELSRGEWVDLGCGTNTANSLVATGVPTIGASFTLGVDDPSAHINPFAVPILWVSALAAPGPCGTVVPGYGMNSNVPGALLVDISIPAALLLIGPPWTTPGVPVTFVLNVPNSPTLVGAVFNVQGALFDTVDFRFGAAEGLRGVIGE